MARSKSELDNIISNSFNKRKEKEEEDKNNKSETTNVRSQSYIDKAIDTSFAKKSINFDTLGTDLTSVGTSIHNAYTGWQSPETLKNTRASAENVYNRLLGYQDYQKKYGDGSVDLGDLIGTYKYALDNWDDLAFTYSGYKDADAWKSAVATSEGMKTADLGVIQKEISELEGILSSAKEYSGKAKSVTQRASNFQNRSGGAKSAGGYADEIRGAEKEYNDYLASVGYGSVEEIEKALIYLSDDVKADVVFTTGGTGLAPRDVTPEATKAILEKYKPELIVFKNRKQGVRLFIDILLFL